MRRIGLFLVVAAMLAAPAAVFAAEPFSAVLSPEAEVPPVTGNGSGSANVSISDDESEISYEVSYQDLTGPVLAGHIHFGAEDVAGGVILPLTVGDSPFSGTLTEADFTPLDGGPQTFAAALEAIRAGQTYINLHTAAHQGGEIRGQLGPLPDTATDVARPSVAVFDGTAMAVVLLAGLVALFAFWRYFRPRAV
jgi:hypothetical protein